MKRSYLFRKSRIKRLIKYFELKEVLEGYLRNYALGYCRNPKYLMKDLEFIDVKILELYRLLEELTEKPLRNNNPKLYIKKQ